MRFGAVLFVVMIHTKPFSNLGVWGNAVHFVINATARFAVPFFFLISGFFFARKAAELGLIAQFRSYAAHVIALYVVGIVINLPVTLVFRAGAAAIHGDDIPVVLVGELVRILSPGDLLYYGSAVSGPLWFLPALLYAVALVLLFVLAGAKRFVLPVAFSLHVLGLFGQGYDVFFALPVMTRDALFFGFFYVAVGYSFGRRDSLPNPRYGGIYLLLTASGFVLQVIERYVFGYVLGDAGVQSLAEGVYTLDYSVATILATVPFCAFLLSRPDLLAGSRIERLGRYAVGIYVIHPAVLRLTHDMAVRLVELRFGYFAGNFLWYHLFLTPFVVLTSMAVFLVLERYRVVGQVERFVSAALEPVRVRSS